MFNLGSGELLVIAFIVVLLFGSKRIPEIMGGFGKGIRNFKKNLSHEEGDENKKKIDDSDSSNS